MFNLRSQPPAPNSQLTSLLQFLKSDPENLNLISDAIEEALNANRVDIAKELLIYIQSFTVLSPREINFKGMIALADKDYSNAVEIYTHLHQETPDDLSIKFNLAWSIAKLGDLKSSLVLLDDETCKHIPQAANLALGINHQYGNFEKAERIARDQIELNTSYPPLMANISVLALDIEDEELALFAAKKAPGFPESQTTIGTIMLGQGETSKAMELFDQAIAQDHNSPRAYIGKGLALLISEKYDLAKKELDRGASLFGTHLGSWIASGWAYMLTGELAESRQRFEEAMEIDRNFAETYGSLSVLYILENNTTKAQELSDTALKLDKECFSAVLAKSMLMTNAGRKENAKRVLEKAFQTPVSTDGKTLAQLLVQVMGTSRLN